MIHIAQVFRSVGADPREPHPRVYIAKTVTGVAIGQGAASRGNYLDGLGHRGRFCRSTSFAALNGLIPSRQLPLLASDRIWYNKNTPSMAARNRPLALSDSAASWLRVGHPI